MHQKRVKVKQLKGGRHNGQFAVITYDQPETDPTVQQRVENEVTVAICRHAVVADVVAGHFRKLFAGLAGVNVPGQSSETQGDPKDDLVTAMEAGQQAISGLLYSVNGRTTAYGKEAMSKLQLQINRVLAS